MKKTEIKLSKKKLVIGVLASVLLVLLGLFFLFGNIDNDAASDLLIIRGSGALLVLLFGFSIVLNLQKLFSSKYSVGLVIDEDGISDRTNLKAVGLIKWEDITGIKTEVLPGAKFLYVYTRNPDEYMARVKSGVKRKTMWADAKMFGSPFAIPGKLLQCKFADLEKLVNDAFNEKKGNADQ